MSQILTTGADKLCAMWDMEYHEPVKTFQGHTSDILGYDGFEPTIQIQYY